MGIFSKIAAIALGCMLMASIRLGADVTTSKALAHPPHPPFKVYVLGQVRHPGEIEIKANEILTISQAILRTGGYADHADWHRVKLQHKKPDGTIETTALIIQPVLIGRYANDPVLQADDMVIVPKVMTN